jgi:hypothetical protein
VFEKPPKLLAEPLSGRGTASRPAPVFTHFLGLLGEYDVDVLEGEQSNRAVVPALPEFLDDSAVLCLADLTLRIEVLTAIIARDEVA